MIFPSIGYVKVFADKKAEKPQPNGYTCPFDKCTACHTGWVNESFCRNCTKCDYLWAEANFKREDIPGDSD